LNTKANKPLLLITVENQVREFDPKLLLACIAVRRGFSSVIGPRRKIESRIPSFPKSIYIAKDLRSSNGKMFRILNKLGHISVAWDEEALVHLPAEMYYSRRLSPRAVADASSLFAWGEENAELWRQYPHLPKNAIINVTGNPRNDLLRPELRAYYNEEVRKIRQAYGNFILVNTNFNHVNAFNPNHNLFQPVKKTGDIPKFGTAARGMSREYAEGLWDHKQSIFEDFQRMIPMLDKAFPDYHIVVRPHPTESHKVYNNIAAGCQRVKVTNEGNVVPWLLATKALVHNGCTTGMEAYVLKVPAITYRATINDFYDFGFYRAPNLVSHQCFNFEELRVTLQKILNGDLVMVNGDAPQEILDNFFAAQDGPLACERIVNILEAVSKNRAEWPIPSVGDRLEGWFKAVRRRFKKQLKSYLPNVSISSALLRHSYPRISLEEVQRRISRLRKVLNYSEEIKAEKIFDHIFKISV